MTKTPNGASRQEIEARVKALPNFSLFALAHTGDTEQQRFHCISDEEAQSIVQLGQDAAFLLDRLRELEDAARWRKVEEELPEERKKVLVKCGGFYGIGTGHYYFNYYTGRCHWKVDGFDFEIVVVGWRYIEPPQEQTQ